MRGSSRAGACGRRSSCPGRPDEPPDSGLADWYRRLLATVADHQVRSGSWQLLEVGGWPDNDSCRNLLAWSWTGDGAAHGPGRHLVVVNLSLSLPKGASGFGWTGLRGRGWTLTDLLAHQGRFERRGDELDDPGLYVDLQAGAVLPAGGALTGKERG